MTQEKKFPSQRKMKKFNNKSCLPTLTATKIGSLIA